jgi:multimeric flavodoxin WrbA
MKILALSGSYRPDGPTEQATRALLAGAASRGAETRFVALRDKDIHFCTNCRVCTQKPGDAPGECSQKDDMKGLIHECLSSDVLILSAPINFYETTALTRKFLERLLPFGYWPWDKKFFGFRPRGKARKAVIFSSSAAPGLMIPLLMPHSTDTLKVMAKTLGAKVVKQWCFGLVGSKPRVELSERKLKKAFALGAKLASA